MAGNEGVSRWLLDNEDNASVVSELDRVAGSEFGEFDEGQYRLEEDVTTRVASDDRDVQLVAETLGAVAKATQRKAVCAFYRQYVRGRMLDFPDYSNRQEMVQRFFQVEGYMQLTSLADDTLIQALLNGPVRTRLSAPTGMGKTRKLPGLIASKCGLRVLQLELDKPVAAAAMKYQKDLYKIPGGVKTWSRERKAYLASMSYHEFRGIVLSGSCNRLFEDFDVFYFDEAHSPEAVVWAAKQYFASFSKPHNSLLVVSATISSEDGNNATASGVGGFVEETTPMTIEDAMDSGRLMNEFLRDRILVLVASDEDVALTRAYYMDHGVDVYILDSASTEADMAAVDRAFRVPTSVVPRVLVAEQRYGTSSNFPVSAVISTGSVRVYELEADNSLVEKVLPVMAKVIVQHKGRVGRGLATGAGGWIISGAPARDKEILASEALEAYLSLIAAAIRPRPGAFDAAARVLPKGLNAEVAKRVLKIGLPPALAVRYLGTDGRFASKFVDGVRLFTQGGEVLRKSKDEYPVGYDSWIEEEVAHYYVGDVKAAGVMVRVPFKSPVGLKIQMHTITAVSDGLLDLDYWNWFEEDEESDDEVIGVRTKARRAAVPRMPADREHVAVPSSVGTVSVWQYDADPAMAAKKRIRRRGISWGANGEGKAAITALCRAIDSGRLGMFDVIAEEGVPEYEGKVAYTLPLEESPTVPVKSAGGGRVLLVTPSVHKCFMDGVQLSPSAIVEVMANIVELRAIERFAKSTLFDNWSPAWLSWFDSFAEEDVLKAFKDKALHSDAIKLLNFLYERFRSEVVSVAVSSNLYRSQLGTFFSNKPSLTKFVSAVRKGRIPIAQSDEFVARVLRIKDSYDVAVMALEKVGLFAPTLVTKAQRRLPLRDRHRKMEVIDEAVVLPSDSLSKLRLEKDSWRN